MGITASDVRVQFPDNKPNDVVGPVHPKTMPAILTPRPNANIPECPDELGPVARAEWNRLVACSARQRILGQLCG
jgi:hypothetical protein